MLVKTKCFGEVDISEEKVIEFEDGIMGFEEYKKYTIIYDNTDGDKSTISWLQSMDEPGLALPIINPFSVKEDYNPTVEGEVIDRLGTMNDENTVVFVILTVPADVKKMTANLRAPLVINADTRKACQVIVENDQYPIRYKVFNEDCESQEGK